MGSLVNRRVQRWLVRKAEEALGEDEFNSLKNDLIGPVKIAAREAAADFLSDSDNPKKGKKQQ